MQVTVTPTPLKDLVVLEIKPFQDERGFFIEPWSKRDFEKAGIDFTFVQEGHSKSKRGVLRGLHYQDMTAPMSKLVRCTQGEILDVVVDLRASSPTFGKWYSITLSSENMLQLLVPIGFAHGFTVLSETAEIQYKQSAYYTPSSEGGIIWNDPELAITWSIQNPVLSEKDLRLGTFAKYKTHPVFP